MQPGETSDRPLLSVIVPVYNGGPEIVANVETIKDAVVAGLRGAGLEVIVVSDGSIDGTDERLLEARNDVRIRVLHYDRNLGKGYAVKLGALASRGAWVALVDADLDLDPSGVPTYLEIARRDALDLAIGSKRHPGSTVHYPRSRRVMSWGYQQLNRLLFGLDVRDTQVGLKVFRREVVDEVFPLLLVKRFAIDLELLAVANALGYGRIRELPVRLDYRFTGSGVGSVAVTRALLDTAAIFYRLRVLRTYQRKRSLLAGRVVAAPLVAVVADASLASRLDYPRLEVVAPGPVADVVARSSGALIAVLGREARPAGNWISAAVPYFAREEVAAVVAPELAPQTGTPAERAAAAIRESRLGAGSRRSRYFPGNVRIVGDHDGGTIVVRRVDLAAAVDAGITGDRLVPWLAERRRLTVSTPDTMVVSAPDPLFRPHLRTTRRQGEARGRHARRTYGRSMSGETAASLLPAAAAVGGTALALGGSGDARDVGVVLVAVYVLAVAGASALAGLRFRDGRVALLAAPGLVLTQGAYVAGFLRGVAGRRGSRRKAPLTRRAGA